MAQLTDKGFVRDRNFDDCLRWLYDRLRLTPEEEYILLNGRKPCVIDSAKPATFTRMSESDKQFILDNYEKMPNYEIAAKINKSETAVVKFLIKKGIRKKSSVKRTSPVNYEQITFIRENYKKMSYQEMAEALGIGYMTVYRTVKKLGLCVKEQMPKPDNLTKLNDTEFKVLQKIAEGKNDFEIANEIKTTVSYIRNCTQQIYLKLDLGSCSYTVKRVKATLIYQKYIGKE